MKHKRIKGTEKQAVLVAVERHGSVRSALIDNDKAAEIQPWIERFVRKDAHLMTDENRAYPQIGNDYAGHSSVNHSAKEFTRDIVHNNTAESFNSLLERAKLGIFHYMSQKHLPRYLNEIGFRWNHRIAKEKTTRTGRKKNCDDCHSGIRTFLLFVKPCCWSTSPAHKKRRHLLS